MPAVPAVKPVAIPSPRVAPIKPTVPTPAGVALVGTRPIGTTPIGNAPVGNTPMGNRPIGNRGDIEAANAARDLAAVRDLGGVQQGISDIPGSPGGGQSGGAKAMARRPAASTGPIRDAATTMVVAVAVRSGRAFRSGARP
jgi:hypothetical protein